MRKRSNSENYLQLFLNDTPLIDTRAPIEFAQGSFPTAVNLPLMSDEERAMVGTRYKQSGQQAAIALGHALVQGEAKQARVQAWKDFAQQHPDGYLYCFRGGLRSQISQQWLQEAGCDYPRVVGGYKAMRNFLLESLADACVNLPFIVVSGQTGCAKTRLLNELQDSVDLEGLANHRGSAFGKRIGGQPSQIDFENALAIELLKKSAGHQAIRLALEDESHLIGRTALPDNLRAAMVRAPIAVIEMDLEDRTAHTYQNYILSNLADWQRQFGAEQGFIGFSEELLQSLAGLQRRLGGWRYQRSAVQMQTAIAQHRKGDPAQHMHWIRTLLKDYYDPMYQYQLSKKSDRVVFRGSYDDVVALQQPYPAKRMSVSGPVFPTRGTV